MMSSVDPPPDSSGTDMDLLPGEVLSSVFSFLGTKDKAAVALVCTSWRDAVYVHSLWRNVEAKLNLDTISPSALSSLERRGIRRITILSCQDAHMLFLCVLKLAHLERLDLSKCANFTGEQLEMIFSTSMPHLKILNLRSEDLSGRGMGTVGRNVPNLTSLTVQCYVDFEVMIAISDNLKVLEQLVLSNVHFLNSSHLSLRHGMKALARVKTLKELSFYGCPIEDEEMGFLSKGLTNLVSLTVLGGLISDQSLLAISDMCSLQELYLTSCQITNAGLMLLSKGTVRLHTLYLTKCPFIGDECMQYLGMMPSLQVLTFFDCDIGDLGISLLCKGQAPLSCLSLDHSSVTDSGLRELSLDLKSLRILRLENCSFISEEGLLAVVQNLPHLRALILTGISSETKQKLIQLKPRLGIVCF